MTAAHRTLPFNTWVRVVNLLNEKAVDVRITDRGPFVDGRIIDLSHAAARAIDADRTGDGAGPGGGHEHARDGESARVVCAFRSGAFREQGNAERMRAQMAAKYGAARLVVREGNPALWRVLVGAEQTEERRR